MTHTFHQVTGAWACLSAVHEMERTLRSKSPVNQVHDKRELDYWTHSFHMFTISPEAPATSYNVIFKGFTKCVCQDCTLYKFTSL